MKLLYARNSPYARRIRIAIRELGLQSRVQETDLDPLAEHLEALLVHGPAGKVPVLVTDDGVSLCESLIIARHLDRLCGGRLYPGDAEALDRTLAIEGIASALMDSLFVRARENRRDAAQRSQSVIDLERTRAGRLYDALEKHVDAFGDRLHMDVITTVCSLGYADGRHPGDGWRDGHPRLARWFEDISCRAAMADTAPSF